ncbi:hypothetical protein [Arthrobacter globiformis]|uniref:hypothetical protein n=1 Tax=Arthrobacter globiformis TaxID=1665 RepID=UPI0027824623|nr:hypothetical protein [Arthrobacter globiformis]MDQ0867508.1 hypothetical protein [Arthrobacter globiformis]
MDMKLEVPVVPVPNARHEADGLAYNRGGHSHLSGPDGNVWILQDVVTTKAAGR